MSDTEQGEDIPAIELACELAKLLDKETRELQERINCGGAHALKDCKEPHHDEARIAANQKQFWVKVRDPCCGNGGNGNGRNQGCGGGNGG